MIFPRGSPITKVGPPDLGANPTVAKFLASPQPPVQGSKFSFHKNLSSLFYMLNKVRRGKLQGLGIEE